MTQARILELMVEADGDLLLRERFRRSNALVTHPYVPGSALRGSLAALHMAVHGEPGDEFRRLFIEGDVAFVGGYPTENRGGTAAPLMQAPASLYREKKPTAGPQAMRDFALQPGERPVGWKRYRGLVAFDGNEAWPSDGGFLHTRHRIGTLQDGSGRADKRPAEGGLFSETVIRAGTVLRLGVAGSERDLQALLDLLGHEQVAHRLSLGRSRTVMGMATVTAASITPVAEPALVDGDTHTLLFVTEAVIYDRHHRSIAPDAAWLASLTGASPNDFKVTLADTGRTVKGGWSAVHGGPKPFDSAIERGSVIGFECSSESAGRVAAALARGVGWRRSEGFGQVAIDHPIHRATWIAPGPPAPPSDNKRNGVARAAEAIAQELHKKKVTHRLWRSIENAIVRGEEITPSDPAVRSQHSQAKAGRLAASGDTTRSVMNTAITTFNELAKKHSGWEKTLARDIGRELLLLGRGSEEHRASRNGRAGR